MFHQPVLVEESIQGLIPKPGGIYVDATYGGGGHAARIIENIGHGVLIAFDQDKAAEKHVINDRRLIFINHNFRYMKNFLKYLGFDRIDGILADLGVSSHHLDAPERGFSFRFDAPLDMRMNQNATQTASDIINTYSAGALTNIFKNYGEIRKTGVLVDSILNKRTEKEIATTSELVDALKDCIPYRYRNKFLAKVFQALRIEVNRELENLKHFLTQSQDMLKSGGRLVVISYHSIEDRIVKNYMKSGRFSGEPVKDFYGNVIAPFTLVNKSVIVPSSEEVKGNNRARSARLRIAEKL
ncbi:MAG: 16S rRNA (cytosine(1402)-N(4))-methyltransferase RsmH [Bacteroidales bacterium]|nr:16S rRNA (cytosine(1402)-N(4))-methyltransferase RsmH [Bacteroidales bacterium]MBS3774371.1 16S rRNA (cytosine(1402)-N(4))-methyltransferase RsmH [Bacteroidales bacterium]